ncbi:macro domain-containing protein [Streptomyces sp. XD-27]|uniref:macro domain-containing protein n=1 Tax=Streptomyces sp. XD-27 TaxID=3062779 RepID=UPI0026F46D45|nr:hypothetical protein [Streptomyces sp. XD-27]WKX69538.1 hypothetical protein Q3Y56_06090 [Streptomyces sp. XD-27]
MPPETAVPAQPVDHASIVRDLRAVRRAGIIRLRALELPALERAAAVTDADAPPASAIERLLRLSVARLDAGSLREAAEYTLGLAPGTRDWPGADRRRRSAGVYGVSVERFRKHHEAMVLGQVAEHIAQLTGHAAPPTGSSPDTHRSLRTRAGRRTVAATLHIHPVDLLRDVDVIVSPTNTYLALPEVFKSSVSASLRRAGARRGVTGELVADRIRDELRDWASRQGTSGRPVLPGTVAATGPGALAEQGVRRIYHTAVAVPRAGTNDYDVLPTDVTRAVTRALALLAEESGRFDPPLRSLCLPLIGSGRGGLSYQQSIHAIWAALEAELARGTDFDLHVIVRQPAAADVLVRALGGDGPAGIRPDSSRSAPSPSGVLEPGIRTTCT